MPVWTASLRHYGTYQFQFLILFLDVAAVEGAVDRPRVWEVEAPAADALVGAAAKPQASDGDTLQREIRPRLTRHQLVHALVKSRALWT